METNKTKTTGQKQKKSNAMKKIGKTIKDTFVEMSSSLAGWIDDTGAQFTGKKSSKTSTKTASTTQQKTTSSQTNSKTNA